MSASKTVAMRFGHSKKLFPILRTMTSKQSIPRWATLDPDSLGVDSKPHHVLNIVGGKWSDDTKNMMEIPNPMNKDSPPVCTIPDTTIDELGPFKESMKAVTKSGVHNPLKNVQRYLMYGEISRRVSDLTYLSKHL